MSQRSLAAALFCAGVIYLTLFYQLGHLAFVGADEARYARVGEEMNLKGDYVTPTLDFRPWLEKPPLLFWLEAASFRLFGVGEWTARLPSALLALFCLVSLGLFLKRLAAPRVGLLAVLTLSTSSLFFIYARAASTDMPLVATLSGALLVGFYSTRSPSAVWAGAAGVLLGLAVLAKGPVAVLLFLGVFGAYFLLRQRIHWTPLQAAVLAATLLLTAAPWFWMVWQRNGASFVSTFWINHHLARFLTEIHHHSQPVWYYLPVLAVGFFPWVAFLFPAARGLWKRRGLFRDATGELQAFLWLWALVPFLFFSASGSKLAGYILPSLPPLAALVALEWDGWMRGADGPPAPIRRTLAGLSALGLLLVGGVAWAFFSLYESPSLAFLLSLPLLAGMAWAWREERRRRPAAVFLSLVASTALFAALLYWRAAPVVDDFHSTRDLCQRILPRLSTREPLILYRYFHHTAHYYTDYRATREAIPERPALLRYLESHPQKRYFLLTQEEGWQDLQPLHPRLLHRQGNLYLAEIPG